MDELEADWSLAHIVLVVWNKHLGGIAIYDKWVVRQINCSYCPCSATLSKGKQCWLCCWCCAQTHSDELTLYAEIHIKIMSSYQAFVNVQLDQFSHCQSAGRQFKGVWSFGSTLSFPPEKHQSVENGFIQLKDCLKTVKWLLDYQVNINQWLKKMPVSFSPYWPRDVCLCEVIRRQ